MDEVIRTGLSLAVAAGLIGGCAVAGWLRNRAARARELRAPVGLVRSGDPTVVRFHGDSAESGTGSARRNRA